MERPNPAEGNNASVLQMLRWLRPSRGLTLREATRLAELQAAELRYAFAADEPRLSLTVVSGQPNITVERDDGMPDGLSGTSTWSERHRGWVITLNGGQPPTRQRFTALHEYKHIIDHGQPALRVRPETRCYGLAPAEFLADYFAGCALVPGYILRRLWHLSCRDVGRLSQRFDVSERAIEVRLEQVGLTPAHGRCGAELAAMSTGRAA